VAGRKRVRDEEGESMINHCLGRPNSGQFPKGHIPWNYTKRNIPLPWENENAAYIFGCLLGDASLMYNSKEKGSTPKGIQMTTVDEEFVETFSSAVKSAFDLETHKYLERRLICGRYHDYFKLMVISADLSRICYQFRIDANSWYIPKSFFNTSRAIRLALVQGYFDSDGYARLEGKRKTITAQSVNEAGLKDISNLVKSLGYASSITGPYPPHGFGKKEVYCLRLPNGSSELFRIPRKRKALT
jgi:hypothetical protein